MLELIGISRPIHEIITFDFYIPIKVQFGYRDALQRPFLYANCNKLVEIAINQQTNEIGSFSLVLVSKVYFYEKTIEGNLQEQIGLPIFNTEKWVKDNPYIDENRDKDYEIYVGEDNVVIFLAPENKIELLIRNGCVIFGFDKNKFLCCIKVEAIAAEDMDLIHESLKSKIK